MDSVLFSIQPEHCKRIIDGVKEWEFRTRPPKSKKDYKGFIYCTQGNIFCSSIARAFSDKGISRHVIGEFICDDMVEVVKGGFVNPFAINNRILERGRLSPKEMLEYTDHYRKDLYALHISQLVIYDEPKELTDFMKPLKKADCGMKDCADYDDGFCAANGIICDKLIIKRAPQSWCYAEML
jgi:predicted transcriptional regulator